MTNANSRCSARTRSGAPCGMAALKGQSHCFTHSPKTASKRRVARRRGGQATRTPKARAAADVASIQALQRHVGQVLADVLLRDNTERRAGAIARLVEVARGLIEVGDMERRLEMIEQRLDARTER